MGVAAKVLGIATEEVMIYTGETSTGLAGPSWVYEQLKPVLGDSLCQTGIKMNDDGESFDAIADKFEEFYNRNLVEDAQ